MLLSSENTPVLGTIRLHGEAALHTARSEDHAITASPECAWCAPLSLDYLALVVVYREWCSRES